MQTLLEMTQDILSEIGGDEITSISDTEESDGIARIIRTAYRDLSSHTSWPKHRRAVSLTERANVSFPTHFTVNSDVKQVISIYYDTRPVGDPRRTYIRQVYKDPDEFLVLLNTRNSTAANVSTIIDDSGIELLIINDKAPQYYTSFDDVNIIFDSFDSGVETYLVETKLQAQGYIVPAFTLSDAFTPDLPVDAFSLLYQESLSRVQLKFREFQDVKAEGEARKQSAYMSRNAFVVSGGVKYPNYGRKR